MIIDFARLMALPTFKDKKKRLFLCSRIHFIYKLYLC